MTVNGWLQIAFYFVVLTALVVPLGRFMARVFEGERTFLTPVLQPVEKALYWLGGVDEKREQHWITYTVAMLLFNAAGFLVVYGLMRLQAVLPLNPADQSAVAPDLSFNTAVSFATNTNWQNYGGESTLSYLTQMVGLTTQNFVSAATGIALVIALIRAFARASMQTVGNFWVDLTRCTLYVLLPLSIIGALILVWQGVPQNLGAYVDATTLEGAKQTLSQGPAASQIAIKQLGTNGGGFWNANSSVPYENPTPLSNFVEVLFILLISAALTHTFGRMVKDERQGWAIYAVMSVIFLGALLVCYWAEAHGNDHPQRDGAHRRQHGRQGGPLRHRQFEPVGDRDDRRVERLGQFHARQLHAARRDDPHGDDRARRSHLWRRRLRPLRHAALRHPGRVHRRSDGRPHAGISRQEARGQGSQDGHARHPGPAAVDPRLHRRCGRDPVGRCVDQQSGSAWLLGDSLRLRLANRQQRFGVRRADRQHAVVQHDRRPCDADRALLRHHSDDGDCRLAGREEIRAAFRRHLPDPRLSLHRPRWSA